MKLSPKFAWFVMIAGVAGCAHTSRYYLPEDPGITSEGRGSCIPVKFGGALFPLSGVRVFGLTVIPRDRQLSVRLDAWLDVGERLRLLGPTIHFETVPAGNSFDVTLSPWHSRGYRKGGAIAYDELVPLGGTILGRMRDLGDGVSQPMSLFVTEASVNFSPSEAYRITMPGVETGVEKSPERSFVVHRREDTSYFGCFQ